MAALGHPEIWPAAEAMEAETGRKWTPLLGDADFWLVRLACTLREPQGRPTLVSAEQHLFLRPRDPAAGQDATYAHSLLPRRLGLHPVRHTHNVKHETWCGPALFGERFGEWSLVYLPTICARVPNLEALEVMPMGKRG